MSRNTETRYVNVVGSTSSMESLNNGGGPEIGQKKPTRFMR